LVSVVAVAVFSRNSWVTAIPIEAKAREVRIQARNVRSAGNRVRSLFQGISISHDIRVQWTPYQEPGGRERHSPYFLTRVRRIDLRFDWAMTGAARWGSLVDYFARGGRHFRLHRGVGYFDPICLPRTERPGGLVRLWLDSYVSSQPLY
jgi:hypothetical protein